jgi:hypothetical protein
MQDDDDYMTREVKKASLSALHLQNRKMAYCISARDPQVKYHPFTLDFDSHESPDYEILGQELLFFPNFH